MVSDLSTFLLPLIASALGGAVVAGGFGIYNYRTAKIDERAKWVRDHKLEAYAQYLDTTLAMGHAVTAYRVRAITNAEMMVKFADFAPGKLEILAPKALRAAADDVDEILGGMLNNVRNPTLFTDEDEAAFDEVLEQLNAGRREVVRLVQQDLNLDEVDYSVSGSELPDIPAVAR